MQLRAEGTPSSRSPSSSNRHTMLHADPVCAEPKLFVGGLRFEGEGSSSSAPAAAHTSGPRLLRGTSAAAAAAGPVTPFVQPPLQLSSSPIRSPLSFSSPALLGSHARRCGRPLPGVWPHQELRAADPQGQRQVQGLRDGAVPQVGARRCGGARAGGASSALHRARVCSPGPACKLVGVAAVLLLAQKLRCSRTTGRSQTCPAPHAR